MFVSLDQIEFYHGPPHQQTQKRALSPARRKQSSTFAVTEPIRHSVPTESNFTPGFHNFAIPSNGPEPTALQPCDKPSTSINEAWNVFDMELAHLDHRKRGAHREGSDPPEGNDRSCPNHDDREVQLDEDKACHHIEPEDDGAAIVGSAAIETAVDLPELPSCLLEQADTEGSTASSLPRSGRWADQPCCQDQLHGQMADAAHTDEGCAPRTASVPCSDVAEPEGIAPCNRIGLGVSPQELDMPPLPRSIPSSPVVESETLSNKQGDATGSAPLDRNQERSQDETSGRRRASDHEPNQESGTSMTGPYPPSQLTAPSIRGRSPSPDQANMNHSKRHSLIAVAVSAPPSTRTIETRSTTKAMSRKMRLQHGQGGPAPPSTRTKATRSTTKAMPRKMRLQHGQSGPAPPSTRTIVTRSTTKAMTCKRQRDQVGDSGHYTSTPSIDPTDRIGEKGQRQRKKAKYVAGAVSASGRNPMLSDVSPENQNIPGRAILTVHSNGSKPAFFFTFIPELDPKSSLPDPYRRHADRDQSLLAESSATISGKPRSYTSDENARLVRLKERERMSWVEIAEHFPGRNSSSLQVHYSTKLRQKATTRSRKR